VDLPAAGGLSVFEFEARLGETIETPPDKALEARGVPAMERHKRALGILDTVGLDGSESVARPRGGARSPVHG